MGASDSQEGPINSTDQTRRDHDDAGDLPAADEQEYPAQQTEVLVEISECATCVFEQCTLAVCVESDGGYLTKVLLRCITRLSNWRKNWKRDMEWPMKYKDRASKGQHPFASDPISPWDPIDGVPIYHHPCAEITDFWMMCDKLMRWTTEACRLPADFWKRQHMDNEGEEDRTQWLRLMAVWRGVRAIWGKSKLQFTPCLYLGQQPDTFYVSPYFYKQTSQKMSAEVLFRLDGHGLRIYELIPDHLKIRMDSYRAGERANLGPRSRVEAERRQLAGERPRAMLRNVPEPRSSASRAASTARRGWQWREEAPGPWRRPGDDEEPQGAWWERQEQPAQEDRPGGWNEQAWQSSATSSAEPRRPTNESWNEQEGWDRR